MKKILFTLITLFTLCSSAMAEDLPTNFYTPVNGKKDAQLKGGLKALIRSHTAIPYGNGIGSTWEVFYYSDQDEEGYCMDMYCDNWYKFGSEGK